MPLFKDKTLNLAILVSTIWHFFWFACFAPFFASTSTRTYGKTIVSFLGAILKEVAPETRGEIRSTENMETKEGMAEIALERPQIYSKPVLFEKDEGAIYKETFVVFKKISSGLSLTDEGVVDAPDFFIIEGKAKQRELLYQPNPGMYRDFHRAGTQFITPELVSEVMPYEVRLRFFVSPEGEVLGVEKLLSSGSGIIDEFALRYVKGLKFLPLSKDTGNPDEGIIVLKF